MKSDRDENRGFYFAFKMMQRWDEEPYAGTWTAVPSDYIYQTPKAAYPVRVKRTPLMESISRDNWSRDD